MVPMEEEKKAEIVRKRRKRVAGFAIVVVCGSLTLMFVFRVCVCVW